MKKLHITISVLFAIVFFYSCNDDKLNEDFLWFSKAETKCADPWGVYANKSDSELKSAVKRHLNEELIEYDKIVIEFDSSLVSPLETCLNTTGRRINVHASIIREEVLNGMGFFAIPDE